jgi:hypothetical protein
MVRGWIRSFSRAARCLCTATHGGVAVIGALSLTTIVGMGAFAVEATQGYAAKTNNQRVADMAALAGALAYNVNNSTSEMTATAKAVVAAQGLPANSAAVALTTDAASGKQLVQVTVTSNVPLALGRVLTSALSYDVSAVGAATTSTTATPACIAAVSGTPATGIAMSGGTSITASGCAVATNAGIAMTGSASITGKEVDAGKSISKSGGASIATSPNGGNVHAGKAHATSDWMLDDAGLKLLLCRVNKLNGTTDSDYPDGNTACASPLVTPAAPGPQDWSLDYSPDSAVAAYWKGSGAYIVPPGTYAIRNLSLAGGITATFQGPVNLTIASISMGGGTTLHIGNGNISVSGKIDLSGGALADIDVGVGNAVTIGATAGTAISVGGGSRLCFTANCAAPTAAAGTFSAGGDITSNGGSTIIFPKAATHVIDGDLDLSGSSTFGSGSYVIAGDFTNNTGGTMSGADVTFALGGTFTLSGGTSLDLAAPGASSSYGVPGLLFATKSSADSRIGGGSSDQYAGLLYAPDSDLTISGGAAISANGSNCMMMIVGTLTLSGGGSTSTGTCPNLASRTVDDVALFK